MIKNICIITLVSMGFLFGECPTGFYEDDCDNCWLPYCYNLSDHQISYDSSEDQCNENTSIWIIPGDNNDIFYNNYCDYCPDEFDEDDCGNCWMGYCYTFFQNGLNGDGPHSIYYDLDQDECVSYGYGFYLPGDTGDPYYNSNCETCPEGEIYDDCGVCQTGEDSPYWNMSCQDCNGEPNGYALIDDCGDCQSAYCYDYVSHIISFELPCDGPTEMLVSPDNPNNPYWNENCSECQNELGDVNTDNSISVADLVLMVSFILGNTQDIVECAADVNSDQIINVVDVVTTVQIILGGLVNDATYAEIIINNKNIEFNSDGYIGGFQFTISHNNDFSIHFFNNALISDYNTINDKTNIIIIKPFSNKLFSINGEFEITDIIALNSKEYIEIKSAVNPSEFLLNNSYPNPFNPNTTITFTIPEDGNIKIEVYDINGKIVEYLQNRFVKAGQHSFEWNAYNQPSGLYLLKVQYGIQIKSQKLYLIK